jgi:homoaconitase/3-isopropylmalate dehydratase large subunit
MSGSNIAEKILAAHSGRKKVSPGEFLNVKVDLVLANDITAPIAIKEFAREHGVVYFEVGYGGENCRYN